MNTLASGPSNNKSPLFRGRCAKTILRTSLDRSSNKNLKLQFRAGRGLKVELENVSNNKKNVFKQPQIELFSDESVVLEMISRSARP